MGEQGVIGLRSIGGTLVEIPMKERYERAATWLPYVVGMLLVAIVAVFIFSAPDQITSPNDAGYLLTTPASAEPMQTAMR